MKALVKKFDKLSNSNIIIEANNIEYQLKFDAVHFKHLLGVQYLKDIKELNLNAIRFYNKCKANKIKKTKLKQSSHYIEKKIEQRLMILENILEVFLNTKYFTGNEFRLMFPYSKIESTAVLQFKLSAKESKLALLHVKIDESQKIFVPISLYTVDENQFEGLRIRSCLKKRRVYSWKIINKSNKC